MRIEIQKFFFLSSVMIFILVLWDFSIMKYWKMLSVIIHESFHAGMGFLLGGENIIIQINNIESGTTYINKLNNKFLPIVTAAGYLGTIFMGGFLLNRSFQYKQSQLIAFLFGNWLIFTVLFFIEPMGSAYNVTLYCGVGFILVSFIGKIYSNLLIIFIGSTLILYGVYDIYDIFIVPEITDAGMLAKWILQNMPISTNIKNLSLQVGLFWYILGVCGIVYFNRFLFFGDSMGEKAMDKMVDLVNKGNVSKETADWFLEKGKDLDGNPLSRDNKNIINGRKK